MAVIDLSSDSGSLAAAPQLFDFLLFGPFGLPEGAVDIDVLIGRFHLDPSWAESAILATQRGDFQESLVNTTPNGSPRPARTVKHMISSSQDKRQEAKIIYLGRGSHQLSSLPLSSFLFSSLLCCSPSLLILLFSSLLVSSLLCSSARTRSPQARWVRMVECLSLLRDAVWGRSPIPQHGSAECAKRLNQKSDNI